jgi:type III pantothenate kinase
VTDADSRSPLLEFDVGNTRLKWRLRDNAVGKVLGAGALVHADYDDCAQLLAVIKQEVDVQIGRAPSGLWVASVASDAIAGAIDVWARDHYGLAPEFARVSRRAAGVTVGYEEHHRLGVDRWLAVLAASVRSPQGALVVDCGSAITVDVLHGQDHRGGYIVPGLRLMRGALFRETEQVKVAEVALGDDARPGRVTEEAVDHGLPLMAAGLVVEVLDRLKKNAWGWGGWSGPVYLTGGDAAVIAPLLGERQVYRAPDLVLDGLSLAEREEIKD